MLFVIDVTRTCGRRKETVSKSKRSVFGLLRHQSVGLVDLQSFTYNAMVTKKSSCRELIKIGFTIILVTSASTRNMFTRLSAFAQ